MREHNDIGTSYIPSTHAEGGRNIDANVDELLKPHVQLGEMKGAKHRVVAKISAYEPEAQPVQARGRIVWSRAYAFQAHGATYLDPVPDPGLGGGR